MKIQKYRTGGPEVALAANPALGATILEAAPLAIPAALTAAFIRTYENPEDTAYARGVRQALESFKARNAAELAQQKVEDKAYNEGLAKYYSKQLANGPMIKPWVNGGTKTITAYDPTTGTYTATFAYPSGSQLYGTFPEINYRATRNLPDFSDAYITYPNKGVFRADLTSVDGNTLYYEPGQLIKGLTPQISLPTSAAISRLTAEPQVIALPLEGDFYMSKKKKKNPPASQSASQPAGAPSPSQPNEDPNKKPWWKRLWSRNSSQNTSNKSMTYDDFFHLNQPTSLGNGWWKGVGYGLKIAPYTIPIQIGSQHLKNEDRINRTFYEWIGDLIFPPQSTKPEPVQETAPQQEKRANLDEIFSRLEEDQRLNDSLKNARMQNGGR